MSLSELQAKNAKPKERAYKLADGGGLFLLIQPKQWCERPKALTVRDNHGPIFIGRYRPVVEISMSNTRLAP